MGKPSGGSLARNTFPGGIARDRFPAAICTAPGPAVSRRSASRATSRARSTRGRRAADHQPARPYGPAWFADNEPFPDPATLLIVPDHYVYRMLYSQGVPLEDLGVPRREAARRDRSARVWRLFAANFPSVPRHAVGLWLDHAFSEVFGFDDVLSAENADHYLRHIAARWNARVPPARALRAIQHRGAGDDRVAARRSRHHRKIRVERLARQRHYDLPAGPRRRSGRSPVSSRTCANSASIAGRGRRDLEGYLDAHRKRRADFKSPRLRPRPITVTRPRAPPTFRKPRRKRSSRASAAAERRRRTRPSCSAPRC